MLKYVTAAEAVKLVQTNDRVFIHGGAATPMSLVAALTARHKELNNVEVIHIHTEGEALYAKPEYKDSFFVNSFFVGGNLRKYVDHVNVQYVPVFLSEIPSLFRRGLSQLDVAFIQVSKPDKHGYCSLGVSVDIAKAATDVAKKVIAYVNPNMPRSHGDGHIHIRRFAAAVYGETPIFEVPLSGSSPVELAIGKYVASIVEDRATLQMGIGGIPAAVLQCLSNHKDLGVHTEMFTDAVLPLVEKGVINNRFKKRHTGKIV